MTVNFKSNLNVGLINCYFAAVLPRLYYLYVMHCQVLYDCNGRRITFIEYKKTCCAYTILSWSYLILGLVPMNFRMSFIQGFDNTVGYRVNSPSNDWRVDKIRCWRGALELGAFCITGPFGRGNRHSPGGFPSSQRENNAELWCFLCCYPEKNPWNLMNTQWSYQ